MGDYSWKTWVRLGRIVVSVLAIYLLSPTMAMAGTRVVKVCNEFPQAVNVAFAYDQEDENTGSVSRGWLVVPSGNCKSVSLPARVLYWRGETGQYRKTDGSIHMNVWGDDRKFCVMDRRFTLYRADLVCDGGRSVPFVESEWQLKGSANFKVLEGITITRDGTAKSSINLDIE